MELVVAPVAVDTDEDYGYYIYGFSWVKLEGNATEVEPFKSFHASLHFRGPKRPSLCKGSGNT